MENKCGLKAILIHWLGSTLSRLLIPLSVAIFFVSCAGGKAQFFVFPENQHIYHNQNVIRDTFPGWDIDVSIMSPQSDYWYNKCEYCSDYNYYLTFQIVCRDDSNSVWNLESRGWDALKTPGRSEKIECDSVQLTFMPGEETRVLYVDSSQFEESPKYYLPGIHYKFNRFKMPKKTDSLRLKFNAIFVNQTGVPSDTAFIDTVLYRWLRPPKGNL